MFCIVTYPLHFWLGRGSVFASSSSQTKRIGNITLSCSLASFSSPSTTLFPSIGLDVFTGPCALNGRSKSAKKEKQHPLTRKTFLHNAKKVKRTSYSTFNMCKCEKAQIFLQHNAGTEYRCVFYQCLVQDWLTSLQDARHLL